jgi:hypothetical protein
MQDIDYIGEEAPAPPKILRRDLRLAAQGMGPDEIRMLVDYYYSAQKRRIVVGNQARALAEEPHGIVTWLHDVESYTEGQIKAALTEWVKAASLTRPEVRWASEVVGIGPVICSGLFAHLDFKAAPHASSFLRYAGLDPTLEWKKGEKRPWNGSLKVLCWKIGVSFTKHQNRPGCFYGQVLAKRKKQEIYRNENGEYAETARLALESTKWKRDDSVTLAAYKNGRLPDGRIQLRAQRIAVSLFLCHLWEVWYESFYQTQAPVPYAFMPVGPDGKGGLGHDPHARIFPPNWPLKG